MYIQYRNDQFFLPFSVNCSQVALFQIVPVLYPHGQGGVVNKMWTGRGGSQKFQTLCGHPLWMTPYESSGSQFIRTNTGIQSGPEAFDESMLVMTFLTNLGITEICSFRLVLEEKASEEIPELSEFLEKFLENSFAFIEFRRQHWPLSRRVMADLPLWRTILAIPRKLR